jgi:fumarylacetoacetate (FAA) hydrolase
MFRPRELELERGWPGRIDGDRVIQLAAQSLEAFFTGGGSAREHAEFRLDEVELRPPVLRPPSIRLFEAFDPYDPPGFAFGNTASIYGPDEEIPFPEGVGALGFELEVAAMIGAEGAIAGFTILNDWTARDLERAGRGRGLGAKAKDFAVSIGPVLVTADAFDGRAGDLVARVNGVEVARGTLAALAHPWERLRSTAARNTRLRPGDLLASGAFDAVPGGEPLRELLPGDLVELEVEGIGVLGNRVGSPASGPRAA